MASTGDKRNVPLMRGMDGALCSTQCRLALSMERQQFEVGIWMPNSGSRQYRDIRRKEAVNRKAMQALWSALIATASTQHVPAVIGSPKASTSRHRRVLRLEKSTPFYQPQWLVMWIQVESFEDSNDCNRSPGPPTSSFSISKYSTTSITPVPSSSLSLSTVESSIRLTTRPTMKNCKGGEEWARVCGDLCRRGEPEKITHDGSRDRRAGNDEAPAHTRGDLVGRQGKSRSRAWVTNAEHTEQLLSGLPVHAECMNTA